jgi:hypothetical protein
MSIKKIEFSETEVDYASDQSITRFSKKGKGVSREKF